MHRILLKPWLPCTLLTFLTSVSQAGKIPKPPKRDYVSIHEDTSSGQLVWLYPELPAKKRKLAKEDADEPYYEQTTYRSTAAIMRSLRPKSPILYKEYLTHYSGKVHPRGAITTKIFIGPEGRVIEARIIGDSIKDSAFAAKTIPFSRN